MPASRNIPSIRPDGFLRGCAMALVVATIIAAAVARWWPFGDGFPAFAGGALAGVAVAFLFIPWRWIDALRLHIRALERLAAHARDMSDPLIEKPRAAGRLSQQELRDIAGSLKALADQRRSLTVDLRQSHRTRDSAIKQDADIYASLLGDDWQTHLKSKGWDFERTRNEWGVGCRA